MPINVHSKDIVLSAACQMLLCALRKPPSPPAIKWLFRAIYCPPFTRSLIYDIPRLLSRLNRSCFCRIFNWLQQTLIYLIERGGGREREKKITETTKESENHTFRYCWVAIFSILINKEIKITSMQ